MQKQMSLEQNIKHEHILTVSNGKWQI